MLQKFEFSDRRIFDFPAVRPCEGIAPITLLDSLINLAHRIIDHDHKSLTTQKKNTREAIRQVGILLIFLQELRNSQKGVPDSIVLSLSELHVAFQKVKYLMEDLLREGGKMWMLVNCRVVAGQLRGLIRAIATVLDVLPLSEVDVGEDVIELVEMVARQARKVRLEVEMDDDWCTSRVMWILNRFEKGIEPRNVKAMREVLDYLGIKSWSECNREVEFLEEEIGFESLESGEKNVSLLSSLVGFMCYCRGVVFENSDVRNCDPKDVLSSETLSCLNPEDFRCPISLELMTDPVTVSTGQTYDRYSIQKWLKAGNLICPKTGEKLVSTELVPNTSLRKLIKRFCADNGISILKSGDRSRDVTRSIVPGSLAAEQAMKFLSKFLARRLVVGTGELKNKAAYEIRLLGKSSIFNRSCLIESGTIPPLLNLLGSTDKSLMENAVSALLKLAKHANGRKLIVETGGLLSILFVLKNGPSLELRQLAAAIIFYLSSVKGYKKIIGETPDAIPALVELIKSGTTSGKKNVVVAIFSLLLYPDNSQRVIETGTIQILIDTISTSDKEDLISDSLAVIAKLADSPDATTEILQTSALPLLNKCLRCLTSRSGKEYCASILLSLCTNAGEEVIATLAKDPSVMPSLYALLGDGTSPARKKARSLIQLLHAFHETNSSGMKRSNVQHGQSVHVW